MLVWRSMLHALLGQHQAAGHELVEALALDPADPRLKRQPPSGPTRGWVTAGLQGCSVMQQASAEIRIRV